MSRCNSPSPPSTPVASHARAKQSAKPAGESSPSTGKPLELHKSIAALEEAHEEGVDLLVDRLSTRGLGVLPHFGFAKYDKESFTHSDTVCARCKIGYADSNLTAAGRVEAKVLPCLHSVCGPCLEQLIEDSQACVENGQQSIICPVCEGSHEVMNYHKYMGNFPVNTSIDQARIGQQQSIECDECIEGQVAIVYCSQCVLNLCNPCAAHHRRGRVTSQHALVGLTGSKDVRTTRAAFCAVHPSLQYEFFCEDCNIVICRVCVAEYHQAHSYKLIGEAGYESHFHDMKACMNHLCAKLSRMQEEYMAVEAIISSLQHNRQTAHNHIEQLNTDTCVALDKCMTELEKALAKHHHDRRSELEQQKARISTSLVDVWRTIDFLDTNLTQNTPVELLRVNGWVQSGVQALLEDRESLLREENLDVQKFTSMPTIDASRVIRAIGSSGGFKGEDVPDSPT